MRRMTKLMAAMLVMTGAMTMTPQKAEASLWNIVTELLSPSAPDPVYSRSNPAALSLKNSSGRDVRFRVWSNYGEYSKIRLTASQTGYVAVDSDATYFAVEAAVWNTDKRKYVVKDYMEYYPGTSVEFVKLSRGIFVLLAK